VVDVTVGVGAEYRHGPCLGDHGGDGAVQFRYRLCGDVDRGDVEKARLADAQNAVRRARLTHRLLVHRLAVERRHVRGDGQHRHRQSGGRAARDGAAGGQRLVVGMRRDDQQAAFAHALLPSVLRSRKLPAASTSMPVE
jgi:hypothetical protein